MTRVVQGGRWALAVLLGTTIACHRDDPAPLSPFGARDGGAGAAGGIVVINDGGPVGAGGGGDPGCPTALPANGAACAPDGIECELGNDPRRSCRAYATCAGGRWTVSRQDCPPLPNVTCPATAADARGAACDGLPKGAVCAWPGDEACECTDCTPTKTTEVCSGKPVWMCPAAPAAGCPAALPVAGTMCAGELSCDYGCAFGARVCTGGRWKRQPPVCPP